MDIGSFINSLTGGASGPNGEPQYDQNQWNQTIGTMTPEQFGQAASQAVGGVEPRSYRRHVTPDMDGSNPLGQLPQQQRVSLGQSVLDAILGSGLNPGQVAQGAGVGQINPNQMSPGDLASVLSWLQQNHPGTLGNVASQYQGQPNILQAILGNPALMSAIVSLGEQFLRGRMQGQTNQGGFQGPYNG